MKLRFRQVIFGLLCLCMFSPALPQARADEVEAQNISRIETLTSRAGFDNCTPLFDGDTTTALVSAEQSQLTFGYAEGIGSAYLIFDIEYGPYTVINNDTGEQCTFGENRFLHEFVDLEAAFGAAPKSVTFEFSSGAVRLNELYLFTSGETPDFVQKWDTPKENKTDLILFSTHCDDEQLFFAGLLPYYAGELDYEVLVVYLTGHRNYDTLRCHEMLNGLWAVGVSNYPVIGWFGDYYCHSAKQAYELHAYMGETEEALMSFVVEQLRRFKPQVAVGHDLRGGEYGHGQHMLYADLLCRALEISNDASQFPELAERYGTWDVPKTYLHLWPENPITMDWDQPLARFGGMTAFQVSKELGFACHESQKWGFSWYISGRERASDIPSYSPCDYGLYRTTVGPDTGEQDFFENLTTYAQQDVEAASTAKALAQENSRQRQAEAQASIAAVEAQRLAGVETAQELQLQAEAEARAARKNRAIAASVMAVVILLVGLAAVTAWLKRQAK